MDYEKIGVIGFGEVGNIFSRALQKSGARIIAYDILLDQGEKGDGIKRRIQKAAVLSDSLEHVVRKSDLIFSTVVTQAAKEVAVLCSDHLSPGKIYVDLNSTSPSVKVDMGDIIQSSGADFVEGAILGAVGVTGSKTQILTAGEKGKEVADNLNNLGLNVLYYSPEIGKASLFKMIRSIFSKGLEVIMLEMLVAGKRVGINNDLWEDVTCFMASKPFDEICAHWIRTHAVACKRRYHETEQVLETMKEIGVEPIMSSGTQAFFKRSLSLGLEEAFPEKPDSYEEVIDFIENKCQMR